MLCIGSVYAWSIISAELIEHHGFSALQSQVVFGTLIAVFPITMIFVGRLAPRCNYRQLGYICGTLFLAGYSLAGASGGHFLVLLLGIGILAGIATGFGYWVALTSPVQWFPHRKGLVTGIAAAGFGLGAVFLSELAELILNRGYEVLQLLQFVGLGFGLVILACSTQLRQNRDLPAEPGPPAPVMGFLRAPIFGKLCLGIFLGTFAGLLIIGSLGLIGAQHQVGSHSLVHGVALFAVANFLGRLAWGLLSDRLGANLSIFLALLFQALAIVGLNLFTLSDRLYLLLAFLIGFGFGGNFVLFARETAQVFGVANLGRIYPYVFLGYAVAGIAGPLSGGLLSDLTGSYSAAILLASLMSLAGSLLFLKEFLADRKHPATAAPAPVFPTARWMTACNPTVSQRQNEPES